MAKMMGSIIRKTEYCYYGCCTKINLRRMKDRRMAHGMQRKREKNKLDRELRRMVS